MADIDVVEESTGEGEAMPFVQMAHRVLLAGIGAVALAQNEIEAFVNKLVERGEIAEKDGRKMLNDIMERRRSRMESVQAEVKGRVNEVGQDMDRRVEAILQRMNVPTKKDIDALSEKISMLADKVDQLKALQDKK